MSQVPDLPIWTALLVALLLLLGSAFTLIGSIGLIHLQTFYDRLHAPTIGSSAGVACITAASILCFSILQTRLAIHEVLILLFITITMPVTLMLLARAALFRDRIEGNSPVPLRFELSETGKDGVRLGHSIEAGTEDDPATVLPSQAD